MRPDTVMHWTAIPAAPTSAFKEFELTCLPASQRTTVFHSSGTTTQQPSRNYHNAESLALYEASLLRWFEAHFQLPIADSQLVILTPSPTAAPHSSLVHMFETIRREAGQDSSAYVGTAAEDGGWTLDLEAALGRLRKARGAGEPLFVFGTAFSFVHLLDRLAERDLAFALPPGSCALETGGYKGLSRSLPKAALHALISRHLGIPSHRIVCEYGMSELSSQAYDLEVVAHASESPWAASSGVPFPLTPALSLGEREPIRPHVPALKHCRFVPRRAASLPLPKGEGRGEGEQDARLPNVAASVMASGNPSRLFHFPHWARAQIISPETAREVREGETGLIRVFDLANVYSVMAIQTEDLGIRHGDGFTLAGRAAFVEPRGCSLMAIE